MSLFKSERPKVIFISHVKQEVVQAKALKKDLVRLGYKVFSTPQDKSEPYINYMMQKVMHRIDAVVTLTSPAASRSARIWQDQSYARLHNVPVIPMVVHPFEGNVPMHKHIQAGDNLQAGLTRLRKALNHSTRYTNNRVAPIRDNAKANVASGKRMLTKVMVTLTSIIR
ncbi:MAG: TIR domain-containing protein [Chloroflexota bacterium]